MISLLRRDKWRDDLDGKFPSACGAWSENNGCTRVTLEQSGCVRAKSISTENSLIFSINVDRLLNTQIEQCVDEITGSKLMSPDNLSSRNDYGSLIHVSFNSGLFGFIDDMYMTTEPYVPSGSSEARYLKI